MVDVRKHVFVPEFRVLNDEEKKRILDKYNATEEQFPKIKRKDPMIAELNLKPGTLVEIVRDSPTAGKSVYYRVVIR